MENKRKTERREDTYQKTKRKKVKNKVDLIERRKRKENLEGMAFIIYPLEYEGDAGLFAYLGGKDSVVGCMGEQRRPHQETEEVTSMVHWVGVEAL